MKKRRNKKIGNDCDGGDDDNDIDVDDSDYDDDGDCDKDDDGEEGIKYNLPETTKQAPRCFQYAISSCLSVAWISLQSFSYEILAKHQASDMWMHYEREEEEKKEKKKKKKKKKEKKNERRIRGGRRRRF